MMNLRAQVSFPLHANPAWCYFAWVGRGVRGQARTAVPTDLAGDKS
jgi:hypothetical protein